MKKSKLLGVGMFLLFLGACQDENEGIVIKPDNPSEPETPEIQFTRTEAEMTKATNEFAFDFFREVYHFTEGNETWPADEKENILLSPFSTSAALSMTCNGAAGTTADQMLKVLGLEGCTHYEMNVYYQKIVRGLLAADPQVKLGLANSIWIEEGYAVKQSFIDVNRKYYDAEIRELPFNEEAVDIINNWCATQTHNLIPTMVTLEDIMNDARLFLLNAIYFKGVWKNKFDPEKTYQDYFMCSDATSKEVGMMMRNHTDTISYTENETFKIAELPYGNGSFSLIVLLPQPDISMKDAVAAFTPANWSEWMESVKPEEILFRLPQFTIKDEKDLNPVLKNMGMINAFSEFADFSNITPLSLYIGHVNQKACIEVNEEGTEAAAVTQVGLVDGLPNVQPKAMVVNRPFIVVIKENTTGAVLFMGKIGNPNVKPE